MVAHGMPHVTNDVDLCYRRDRDNIERLVRALEPLNPRLRVENLTDEQARALPFRFDARSLTAAASLTLTTDAGNVDLLGSISGVGDYDQVLQLSVSVDLYGASIAILSLPGLIANKRASGRAKDISALPLIEATLRVIEERDARNREQESD